MEKIECLFVLEKETKGTWRMIEASMTGGVLHIEQNPVIGTLYLRKSKYPQQPKTVKVTVEVIR